MSHFEPNNPRVEVMEYDPVDAQKSILAIAEALANKDGIGDVNSTAKGSGARYNTGKPDFSLIPLCTLEDEARVWAYGEKKYAAWNWAKGMDWSVPFACAMRHLSKWQAGEENDEESGLPHLAHAMCNLRMLTLYAKTYPEGDDRPPKELMP